MLCRATQDRWVLVERSEKAWSSGEGHGKPLQSSCLENPMSSIGVRMAKVHTLGAARSDSVEGEELAFIAAGNAKWRSHLGRRPDGFFVSYKTKYC